MSTTSFIGVVVNPQDKGTVIEPNLKRFGKEISLELDNPTFYKTNINKSTEVMCIYHHFDGSPKLLGKTLLDEFDTYEKAINLVSFGDASSIIGDLAVLYSNFSNEEEWQYTKPKQYKNEKDFESNCIESYIYLFKDGQWLVKQCYSINPEWKILSEVKKK